MSKLASVGNFCPNPECDHYGDVEIKSIIRYGKTKDGRQRFQCKGYKHWSFANFILCQFFTKIISFLVSIQVGIRCQKVHKGAKFARKLTEH